MLLLHNANAGDLPSQVHDIPVYSHRWHGHTWKKTQLSWCYQYNCFRYYKCPGLKCRLVLEAHPIFPCLRHHCSSNVCLGDHRLSTGSRAVASEVRRDQSRYIYEAGRYTHMHACICMLRMRIRACDSRRFKVSVTARNADSFMVRTSRNFFLRADFPNCFQTHLKFRRILCISVCRADTMHFPVW